MTVFSKSVIEPASVTVVAAFAEPMLVDSIARDAELMSRPATSGILSSDAFSDADLLVMSTAPVILPVVEVDPRVTSAPESRSTFTSQAPVAGHCAVALMVGATNLRPLNGVTSPPTTETSMVFAPSLATYEPDALASGIEMSLPGLHLPPSVAAFTANEWLLASV